MVKMGEKIHLTRKFLGSLPVGKRRELKEVGYAKEGRGVQIWMLVHYPNHLRPVQVWERKVAGWRE
jgi:hypothetical protein